MFRWPVEFTPLSLGSGGQSRTATLEVTPRGALFTLAALSHVGHPAHLALIDAYLKGQVRLTPTTGIGEDSRIVASSLAAPLLVAFELGVERLTLADLVLLPRTADESTSSDLSADGRPIFGPDSPRFLLRAGGAWHRVQGAERFESPGCLGTSLVGQPEPWYGIVAELQPNGSMLAELREPSSVAEAVAPSLARQWRGHALARFARAPDRYPTVPVASPAELALHLEGMASTRQPYLASIPWRDMTIESVHMPDPDGYQTLCLLAPAAVGPVDLPETMRDLAWETIEGLLGRPLPERRTEPIALRLVGEDGCSTTLDIGESMVIVRNQTIFAAWVGSDGRVMLKLFPPGGMPTR